MRNATPTSNGTSRKSRVSITTARQNDDNDDISGNEYEPLAPSVLFSGMRDHHHHRNSVVDVDAIEQEINALFDGQLRDDHELLHRRVQEEEREGDGTYTEVESFLSHQPQYQRSIVAKKLQLYEKQLEIRAKQLTSLQQAHVNALQSIQRLQEALESQQKEFDTCQDEWENEKASLLRFRGGGGATGGTSSTAMMLHMKMGLSAASAMARKANDAGAMSGAETQQQREQRLQLLTGAVELQAQLEDGTAGSISGNGRLAMTKTRLFVKKIHLFVKRNGLPFANSIRQVEAQFGYSVGSYFTFFRWIILSFMAISVPSGVALVLHAVTLNKQPASLVVDWTLFVGVAPANLLLPQYLPEEGMLYTLVLLLMQFLLFWVTIRKWISEDRASKTRHAMDEGTANPQFGKIILNGWDFTLTTKEQVGDFKKTISEQIKLTLQDDTLAETLRNRTRKEWYKLYVRRLLAFVLYIVVQAASWIAIVVVTTQSSQIQEQISQKAPFLEKYVANMVPALVTLINSVLPSVISFLTKLEKWDSMGFAIKALVTRLYVAKILNVLIQLVSYAMLLDPFLLTENGQVKVMDIVVPFPLLEAQAIRKNVMLPFKKDVYVCRAEQVASGLLGLVVTDFVVGKVVVLMAPAMELSIFKLVFVWKTVQEKRKQKRKQTQVVPMAEITGDSMKGEGREDEAELSENNTTATDAAKPNEDPEIRPPSSLSSTGTTTATTTSTVSSPDKQVPTIGAAASASPPSQILTKSEFQVPQKMVALLYSCTISLVAIPLAPSAALLALLLHVVNFKFDTLVLMYFQKKPTTPWSAHDAGSFFVKFYFCTVCVFTTFTHFFLGNLRLPKKCAFQDPNEENNASICLPKTFNATSETCLIDTSSPSSVYFQGGNNECIEGYPKCICSGSLACGPFVGVRNGYALLISSVQKVRFVSATYKVLVSNPVVVWCGVVGLAMSCLFVKNSLKVHLLVAKTRETQVENTFSMFKKKIKQLENRLRIHKISNTSGNPSSSSTT